MAIIHSVSRHRLIIRVVLLAAWGDIDQVRDVVMSINDRGGRSYQEGHLSLALPATGLYA